VAPLYEAFSDRIAPDLLVQPGELILRPADGRSKV
jgi:hypothetical protein